MDSVTSSDNESSTECSGEDSICENKFVLFLSRNSKITVESGTIKKNHLKKVIRKRRCVRDRCKNKYEDIVKKYTEEEREHFEGMSDTEKMEIYACEKSIEESKIDTSEPLRFKILNWDIDNSTKNILISKIEQLNRMTPNSSEYFKLDNWLHTLEKLPIGAYNAPNTNGKKEISKYLTNLKKSLDTNIYGHKETKDQILRILAQWINNPDSKGYVIGIQGSPGVGKTKLIKDGICKSMEYPLSFISLSGLNDSSYLNGHQYTYEGSAYGKIVESLIKAKTMNPIFLFDELDKVCNSSKGDEITNTLIHITDPVQNDKYNDKYFQEIDLDLSKSLMIFTYNDENDINPILKDRMITIKVSGYNSQEKLCLCSDYIIPELLSEYNMKVGDIIFEEKILKKIIEEHRDDHGVRNIKRVLNDTLSRINMMKYVMTDGINIKTPYEITEQFYDKYCKNQMKASEKSHISIYC
jgi:ATP-dependent Lon protease